MKKITCLLLACVVLFGLASCTVPDEPTQPEQPTILVAPAGDGKLTVENVRYPSAITVECAPANACTVTVTPDHPGSAPTTLRSSQTFPPKSPRRLPARQGRSAWSATRAASASSAASTALPATMRGPRIR